MANMMMSPFFKSAAFILAKRTIVGLLNSAEATNANRKTHQKMMIFDFETLFLGQNFLFRDNQRHCWIGELLARQSVLSDFCRGAELVKKFN